MFGQEAKLAALINRNPPQVPNEQALVAELRAKLGPGADSDRLLYQIRSARGKTHWAVNSYLRDVMTSSAPGQEDFQPARAARVAAAIAAAAAAATAAAVAAVPAAVPAVSSPPSREPGCGGACIGTSTGGRSCSQTATAAATASPCPAAVIAAYGGHNPVQLVCAPCCDPPESRSPAGRHPETQLPLLPPSLQQQQFLSVALEIGTGTSVYAVGGGGSSSSGGGDSGLHWVGPSLDSLPVSLLEAVFRFLDYRSLCAAAMTSRTMSMAAASESLWSALYASRWGSLIFPTEPHLGATGQGGGPGQVLGTGIGPGSASRAGSWLATVPGQGPQVVIPAEGCGAVQGTCTEERGISAVTAAVAVGAAGVANDPAGSEAEANDAIGGRLLTQRGRPGVAEATPPRCPPRQQQLRTLVQDLSADDPDPNPSYSGSGGAWPDCPQDPASHLPQGSPRQPQVSPLPASDGTLCKARGPNLLPASDTLELSPQHLAQQQQIRNPLPPLPAVAAAASTSAAVVRSCEGVPACHDSAVPGPSDEAIRPTGNQVVIPAASAVAAGLDMSSPRTRNSDGSGGSGRCADPAPSEYSRVKFIDGSILQHSGGGGENACMWKCRSDGTATASAHAGDATATTNVTVAVARVDGGGGVHDAGTAPLPLPLAASTPFGNGGVRRCQYRQQMSFLNSLRCPRCGGGSIVPIVYGFPSPKLMEGMRERRLILGGDHLIENCHVWGCNRCGASFRHFPYDSCENWIAELARPQPQRPSHLPHYTYEL